jgi:hypothetical protein
MCLCALPCRVVPRRASAGGRRGLRAQQRSGAAAGQGRAGQPRRAVAAEHQPSTQRRAACAPLPPLPACRALLVLAAESATGRRGRGSRRPTSRHGASMRDRHAALQLLQERGGQRHPGSAAALHPPRLYRALFDDWADYRRRGRKVNEGAALPGRNTHAARGASGWGEAEGLRHSERPAPASGGATRTLSRDPDEAPRGARAKSLARGSGRGAVERGSLQQRHPTGHHLLRAALRSRGRDST